MWTETVLFVLFLSALQAQMGSSTGAGNINGMAPTYFCLTNPNEYTIVPIDTNWRKQYNPQDGLFKCLYANIRYQLVEVPLIFWSSSVGEKRVSWENYAAAHDTVVKELISRLQSVQLLGAVWNLVSEDIDFIPLYWSISFDYGELKKITGQDSLEAIKEALESKFREISDRESEYYLVYRRKDVKLKFTNKFCGTLLIEPGNAEVERIQGKDEIKAALKSGDAQVRGITNVCATRDRLDFLVYKTTAVVTADDLRRISGLQSQDIQNVCNIAQNLFNNEGVLYAQYFRGCHTLEGKTGLPNLIARLSFQYDGLGGASPSESCFEKHAKNLGQLIQRLFNRNSLTLPVLITQVSNLPERFEINSPSWLGSHRIHPLKYNPSCFELKWSMSRNHIGSRLISETERHLLVVTLSGHVMDPIRWNAAQERHTLYYRDFETYLSKSLSKTLQKMNILRSALTMDIKKLQLQKQMNVLECDVKVTFDSFTLTTELRIRDERRISSTVTALLDTREKMDHAFTFRVTDIVSEFGKDANGIPLPLPQRLQTSAELNQIDLFAPKIPPINFTRGMVGPKVCYTTGPVLSDLVRKESGPPDLTEKIFWCLRTGAGRMSFGYRTIDALVNIKPKTPSAAADPGEVPTYEESYRSSVDRLIAALDQLNIRDFVWYLMPVDFKFPSPIWKISFDYLSLAKSFKLKKKTEIQAQLKEVLQTLASTEGLDYTLEVLGTFEKFTRNMCGVPLVLPQCDGEYCFELTSHSDSTDVVDRVMESDVYELVNRNDRCEPNEYLGFLVYLNYHPQYEEMKSLPGASAKVAQLCQEVPKTLMEQPFWFGSSFFSCARARDYGSYFLLARIQLKAENFGPMNVDEQCLVKVREQLTSILSAENYKSFFLRPIPPLPLSIVDPTWNAMHQANPFLINPICFKMEMIEVKELRLDIQTTITLTQADATNINSIKSQLDQQISGLGLPAAISPLKTEIGAFEMDGNEFTGHYNIILDANVLNKQIHDAILLAISRQSTPIQASIYHGTALKFKPEVHKIVAWVERPVPEQLSDFAGDETEFIASVEASVGSLGLKESLLTLRLDTCVRVTNVICKGRLIFDLFKLGLRLKTSNLPGTIRALTEVLKSQSNIPVQDQFTVRIVDHDVSGITSAGEMKHFLSMSLPEARTE